MDYGLMGLILFTNDFNSIKMIDNNKLDNLLNELKLKNTSVDFNEFCEKTLGKSNEIFKICRLLAQTLVDDGYATFTPNNSRFILLTGKGAKFKGYVQTELDKQLTNNEEKEIEKLKKQNLILSNEKMEYEKTIRRLHEELTISSLLKNWWWLIVVAISLGVTIGGFLLN
jgi:hypothetical protein